MENGKYPVRAANITVKVDGTEAPNAAVMSGSNLSVTTGALAAGTHAVTIDVSDDAGNRTRVCATVTAGSGASAFADTASHWSGGYASLLNARGIMKGESAGGQMYFYPNRNLTRKEFAVTDGTQSGIGHLLYRRFGFRRQRQHPLVGGRCR